MSLSWPVASRRAAGPAPVAGDNEPTKRALRPYVCKVSESLMAAIEKCLDNGIGACLVVEDDHRYVGRLSLDDIGKTVLEGGLLNPNLHQHIETLVHCRRSNEASTAADVLRPELDDEGNLVDITIDRANQFIQVARPDMTRHEFRSVLEAFLSSWISSKGPHVAKFEEEFASYVGTGHGVAVSNGTVALHLALVALGIGAGDEVIVPDLTFAATINAVLYCGATPVIVDVDPASWCMSLDAVRRACTSRTKAIIPVHLHGRVAEIGPIAAFAADRGIRVVEDCAEAHGARYDGRPVGQFGDVGCFSFYANKIVTTGEGGMCLTNSPDVARSLRLLRDHGIAPGRSYWHERIGFNYRITNLQAAIGQAQLWRIAETLERNARIAELYRAALQDVPGVRFPPPMPAHCEPVVWLTCVLVPDERRAALLTAAMDAKIEMRPFFYPLSCLPPYRKYAQPCPNSAHLSVAGVNLPTSRAVDEQAVERVAKVFKRVLG